MINWIDVNKALPYSSNQYCIILIDTMRGIFNGWYSHKRKVWLTNLDSYRRTRKVKYWCPVTYPKNFECIK